MKLISLRERALQRWAPDPSIEDHSKLYYFRFQTVAEIARKTIESMDLKENHSYVAVIFYEPEDMI